VDDQLDVRLEDSELLAEVELTTNLMIAASEVDRLRPEDIDRLLGIDVDGRESGLVRPVTPIPVQAQKHHD
jgi:hypothetical protein